MKYLVIAFLIIIGISCFSVEDVNENRKMKNEGILMQDFVIEISKHAKNKKNNFLIIPQNGAELAFEKVDPSKKLNLNYLKAIDGLGIEELFFNEVEKKDSYRLEMLRQIKEHKKILVSEVVANDEMAKEAINKNNEEGFLCFPRQKNNYHYGSLLTEIENENDKNISSINDCKNYLYLINSDKFSTKKELLETLANTNYDLLLIDLFYLSFPFTKDEINILKKKKNGANRLVISYMNIGAAENWRYYWDANWKLGKPSWLKKNYPDYDNEIIVAYWHSEWKNIIYKDKDSYLNKIIEAGFDGVYLDNVEAYYMLTH